MPLLLIILIAVFIKVRFEFETIVCFGGYKDAFFLVNKKYLFYEDSTDPVYTYNIGNTTIIAKDYADYDRFISQD